MSGAPFQIYQDPDVDEGQRRPMQPVRGGLVDRGPQTQPRNRRRTRRAALHDAVQRLDFHMVEEEDEEEGLQPPSPDSSAGEESYAVYQLPPGRGQPPAQPPFEIYEDPNISYEAQGVIPGRGVIGWKPPLDLGPPLPPPEYTPTLFQLLHATRPRTRRGEGTRSNAKPRVTPAQRQRRPLQQQDARQTPAPRRTPGGPTPTRPVISPITIADLHFMKEELRRTRDVDREALGLNRPYDEYSPQAPSASARRGPAVSPSTREDVRFMQEELRRTRDMDREVLGLNRPYEEYPAQAPPVPARDTPSRTRRMVEIGIIEERYPAPPQPPSPSPSPMGGLDWDEMQFSPLNEEELAYIRQGIFDSEGEPPEEQGGSPIQVISSRSDTRISINVVREAPNTPSGGPNYAAAQQQSPYPSRDVFSPVNMQQSQQKNNTEYGRSGDEEFLAAPSSPTRQVYEEVSYEESENYPTPEVMRGGRDEADPYYGVIDRGEEQMRVSPERARQRDYSPASDAEPEVIEHNVSYNVSVTSLLRVEETPAGSSPPPPSPPDLHEEDDRIVTLKWEQTVLDCLMKKIPIPPHPRSQRLAENVPVSSPLQSSVSPKSSPISQPPPPSDLHVEDDRIEALKWEQTVLDCLMKRIPIPPHPRKTVPEDTSNLQPKSPRALPKRATKERSTGGIQQQAKSSSFLKKSIHETPRRDPRTPGTERRKIVNAFDVYRICDSACAKEKSPGTPVAKKSTVQSPEVDELEKCLNEYLAAESSWMNWRSELPSKKSELPPRLDYGLQKRIIPPDRTPEMWEDPRIKFEMLNTEFMYYASLLKKYSPNLKVRKTRDSIAKWVKKLFGPEYHVTTELQEKRNRYLMALTIGVMSNVILDLFLEKPPTGDLGDPNLKSDVRKIKKARWEVDELWGDILSGLPDPGVLDIQCGLHVGGDMCPESGAAKAGLEGKRGGISKEKDVKESALLDREYRFLLYLAHGFAKKLDNPFEKTTAATWLHGLSAVADDSTSVEYTKKIASAGVETWPCPLKRGVRNDYLQVLLSYLLESRLDGPFLRAPPENGDGGPLLPLRFWTRSCAIPGVHETMSPTSSLADKFLFKQPIPKEGAFAFVGLSGDSLNSWFPDCNEKGDGSNNNDRGTVITRTRSQITIEHEEIYGPEG